MLAIAWLLASAWLGIGLALILLGDLLRPLLRWAVGLGFGWILATSLAFGCASWQGRIDVGSLSIQTVGLAVAAAGLTWWADKRLPRPPSPWLTNTDWRALLLCALLVPVLVIELYSHWLSPVAGGLYSAGNTASDLGWHGAVTSAFLFGNSFPPSYPLSPGLPLTYYFMADLQLAVMIKLGMSFVMASTVSVVPLVLASVLVLHELAMRITGFQATAWLTVLLYFFNGGMGFVYLFVNWWNSQIPLATLLLNLPDHYPPAWSYSIDNVNMVADGILPQRPMPFALALAFPVILIAAHVWAADSDDSTPGPAPAVVWRWLTVAGVVTGLLPMWHLFAWFSLVFLAVLWCLARPRQAWIGFFAGALLPAMPQLVFLLSNGQLNGQAVHGAIYLQPGWMAPPNANVFLYWLRNLGFPLLFAVPAWLTLKPTWRYFLLPFAGLFAFAATVMLSHEPYNNIKLMQYSEVAVMIAMAEWLRRLAAPPARQRWLVALLIGACVASGALDTVRETQGPEEVYSRVDLLAAAFIREHTPSQAVFLTAPGYQNTPSVLAGRPIINGFPLFAVSHGLGDATHETQLVARQIFGDDPHAGALIARYRIDYIFLGPEERVAYHADPKALAIRYPVVYAVDGITIFRARPAVPGGAT